MRVCLVVPESSLPYSADRHERALLKPPVGPLALAAAIAPEHDVRIIDSQLHQVPPARIADLVIGTRPDLVGMSVNFSSLLPSAGIIARRVREALGPGVPIVWGGNCATFTCEEILRHDAADIVVLHEADRSFPDLLARLERHDSWRDVPGIAFLDGDRLVRRPFGRYVEDLDTLPFPSYDSFESPEKYLRAMISTRGCCYSCIYCSTRAMWGSWRARSAGNVLAEMRRHVEEADPKRMHFLDDNFPVRRSRVKEICDGKRDAGWAFEWGFSARIEMVDPDLLRMCADAGCTAIYFGVESGSARVLKEMGRAYGPEEILRTVDASIEVGIVPTCSFMLGIPFETEEDIALTFDLMERVNTPMVQLHVFTPLIGTPVYEDPGRFGVEYYAHNPELDCMDAAVFHRTEHLARERIAELYLEGKGIVAERTAERPAYLAALRPAVAEEALG